MYYIANDDIIGFNNFKITIYLAHQFGHYYSFGLNHIAPEHNEEGISIDLITEFLSACNNSFA